MPQYTSAMDPPSTLKPAQVAANMLETAIAKHRTRPDKIFFKAVRTLSQIQFKSTFSRPYSNVQCSYIVHGRCHALLWWFALPDHFGRLALAQYLQSRLGQDLRRLRLPRRFGNVSLRFSRAALLSADDGGLFFFAPYPRIVLQGFELLTSNLMVGHERLFSGLGLRSCLHERV
jgi:hypothetical protein